MTDEGAVCGSRGQQGVAAAAVVLCYCWPSLQQGVFFPLLIPGGSRPARQADDLEKDTSSSPSASASLQALCLEQMTSPERARVAPVSRGSSGSCVNRRASGSKDTLGPFQRRERRKDGLVCPGR